MPLRQGEFAWAWLAELAERMALVDAQKIIWNARQAGGRETRG
jgi:hypothetical protein